MHAAGVVVFCGLIELHEVVVIRTNPFGRFDGARHQVFVDLAAGQRHGGCAQFRQQLPAQARNTHFQTFEIVCCFHFFVEPATGLCAGRAAGQCFQAKFARQLVPQGLATAIHYPCGPFLGRHPKRNGGEVVKAGMLAAPVVFGADVGLAVARCHFVEHVECAYALAGGKVFNGKMAIRDFANALCQALCRKAQTGEVARPGRYDDQLLALLCDGGGSKRCASAGDGCPFDKLTTIHMGIPLYCGSL